MMNRASTRARPYPYDMFLGNLGVLLQAGKDGKLKTVKRTGQEAVAPVVLEYASRDPFVERTLSFARPYYGMGSQTQLSTSSHFYYYGDGVDLSCGGVGILGPAFSGYTLNTSPGAITQLIEFPLNGVRTLIAAAGKKTYVKTGSSDVAGDWTVSQSFAGTGDAGADQTVVQMADFGGILVVGVDNGFSWSMSATGTWTKGATAHHGPVYVYKERLYAAENKTAFSAGAAVVLEEVGIDTVTGTSLAHTAGDAQDAASWAAQWLVIEQDVIYCWKPDGLFTVNIFPITQAPSGAASPMAHILTGSPNNATNGVGAISWLGFVWAPYSDAYWRFYGGSANGLAQDTVGPERLVENASPVRGQVVANAGFNKWFNYVVLWDGTTSRLCKVGAWLNPEETNAQEWNFDIDTLHGSLKSWTKKATCALVSPAGDPNGNQRLWIGFTDGSIEFCVLPRYSPFPGADANCRFQTSGKIVYPNHDGGFAVDTKLYRGVSGFGSKIDSHRTATVGYALDGGSTVALSGTINANGLRLPFGASITGHYIQLTATLATDSATYSPVFDGLVIAETVIPAAVIEHSFIVRAADRLVRLDGSVDVLKSADDIREQVRTMMAAPTDLVAVMPDGTSQRLLIKNWSEAYTADSPGQELQWLISIDAVQYALAV